MVVEAMAVNRWECLVEGKRTLRKKREKRWTGKANFKKINEERARKMVRVIEKLPEKNRYHEIEGQGLKIVQGNCQQH